MRAERPVRVRLLGPVDIVVAGQQLTVPGLRRQAVLAVLALNRGHIVDRDHLIDLVWAGEPPRGAANTIQSHVSYLRLLVGDKEIVRYEPPGYRLPAETDAEVAEALLDTEPEDLAVRASRQRAALELWRGDPLGALAGLPWFAEQADRLGQLRLRATRELARTRLALGEHVQLLPELERLVSEHPFDEHLHHDLIVALYRSGRQVDALAAYQRLRAILADQLGIDPSPELRALETLVLRQDPELDHRPEPVPVRTTTAPAQLPAAPAAFVGRAGQLSQLDSLVAPPPSGTVRVATIVGMAGAGKTALALHWGHRVSDRFPDGQLFVDLRGYGGGAPVRPIEALSGFLAALGVPPEQAPARADQAAALYRTLTAGRRLLILLDNARAADQVRPLLPAAKGCLVLVTSRERLTGLVARDGAELLNVGALRPDEAYGLLMSLPATRHLAGAPEAARQLADACGHLPLALRIAAATLAGQAALPVSELVSQLRRDTLRTLSIEGDPEAGVAAAFDTSYELLTPPARRLLRLLALVAGPSVTAPAAAALAGTDVAEAGPLLDRLATAHLLERPAPDRYTQHDLVRAYSAARLRETETAAERSQASQRLAAWYLSTVDAAADLLYPHMLRLPRPPAPAVFDDHATALAWLDANRASLVAEVQLGIDPEAGLLADALRGYFHLRRLASDWLVVAEAAVAAGTRSGDPAVLAAAYHSLGTAHRSIGELRAAAGHYTRALRLARQAGWAEAEATARGNLGLVYQGQGRLGPAVSQLTRALAIDRRTGRRAGVANQLNLLALVYLDQGRVEQSVRTATEALALNRESGSRHGQALALITLGQAHRTGDRLDAAMTAFTEALRLCRDVGDHDGEATVYFGLSAVELARGDRVAAAQRAEASLDLAGQGGDPRTEADALIALAATRVDHRQAAAEYARAYDLTGVARIQLEAQLGLARCAWQGGDVERADRSARAVVDRAGRSGFDRLRALAEDLTTALGEDQEFQRHRSPVAVR